MITVEVGLRENGGRYEERMRRAGLHLWYDIDFAASTPLTRASEKLMHLDGVDIVEFVPVILSVAAVVGTATAAQAVNRRSPRLVARVLWVSRRGGGTVSRRRNRF